VFVPQAGSLGTKTRLVSTQPIVYSTTKWKTTRLRLETSVRLTVSLCSQANELCEDRFFIQMGWKLAEISSLECRHDQPKTLIFILALAHFPPVFGTSSVHFRGFSTGWPVANPFAHVRDRREVLSLLVGGPGAPWTY